MAITKFARYTDEELLTFLDDKRALSPVIDELCTRLHAVQEGQSFLSNSNHSVECPVCEAALQVAYDEGNTIFTLELEG